MRKINPTLESQGLQSFMDLLPRPSNIITLGPNKCNFSSPIDALEAASSGDLIVVFPGNYDVGDQCIFLKDNVNLFCLPNVAFTSSNADGTFGDNNVEVNCSIQGFPLILNTSANKLPFNLENSASRINDFYFQYKAYVENVFGSCFVDVLSDTIGGITWTQETTPWTGASPHFVLTADHDMFTAKNTSIVITPFNSVDEKGIISMYARSSVRIIRIKTLLTDHDPNTFTVSNTTPFLISLKVFPIP